MGMNNRSLQDPENRELCVLTEESREVTPNCADDEASNSNSNRSNSIKKPAFVVKSSQVVNSDSDQQHHQEFTVPDSGSSSADENPNKINIGAHRRKLLST